jgi:two-component system, cell cycle response regulator DivK
MQGKSILIIDDNPTNLKLVKVLLTIEGYQIQTATDGHEALDKLKHFLPDLILMDLQLPGIDGIALTKQLKANSKYQNIIIIAITAFAMKGDEERALAAGCDGYIAKPISIQTLPGVLQAHLDGKKRSIFS